ncbi:50S ribosomal protein L4 [Candidatus Woesearchaeota archaeon]|nr:50S ribosomal protein L4 [Candidatus Woesearchaeota archaeon]
MKTTVFNISRVELKKKDLPSQFNEEIRPDIIKRAVVSVLNSRRQKYGASPGAGKRASAELSRRRHKYRGSYGFGISRVPRKILSRRGTRMSWVGAFAPGTVGGRRAHPPKAGKIWKKDVNKKERRMAIRSAMSACVIKDIIKARGHIIPDDFPFLVEEKFENIEKTAEVKKILEKLGFKEELERVSNKKVRAGRGKSRGRKYKKIRGVLIVVSKDCGLLKGARNIEGAEIVVVDKLNAETLAPGTNVGRLVIFTEPAVDRIEKEQLFTNSPIIKKQEEKIEKKKEVKEKKETKVEVKKEPKPVKKSVKKSK